MLRITGPFFDARKQGQPKRWFLRYSTSRHSADGTLARSPAGKVLLQRHRPYYRSKADAEADKPRIEEQYGEAGAGEFLFNRNAASEFVEARKIAGGVSLVEIARFWRRHHPAQPLENCRAAYDRFIADVQRRLGRTRHTDDLRSRLGIFVSTSFGGRDPGSITRTEILNYLKSLRVAARTLRNHRNSLSNFFGWLCENEAILANPVAGVKRRQLPRETRREIRFLSLEQVIRYLRAAERYDPELIPHEIVQLVAGVRADDEMADFRAEYVLPQTREVVIPAEVAKTNTREVINSLEVNFWTWWAAYGPKKGRLRPTNYLRRWRRLRVLASLTNEAEADTLAKLPLKRLLKRDDVRVALETWPWNARRRTFCTYHVAKYQSAEKAALILRHRGSSYTLHNSYRGLGVTREEGVKYFEILPTRKSPGVGR